MASSWVMSISGPLTILGEAPNGGPGSDTSPCLRTQTPKERIPDVLCAARDIILTATGPRDGAYTSVSTSSFAEGIRSFMPLGHYKRAPNQAISDLDDKMFACRVVHRLLNQITGKKISVGGAYNSGLAINARAQALYDALLDVAADYEVPAFVPRGWETRLIVARQRAASVAAEAAETKARKDAEERRRQEAVKAREAAAAELREKAAREYEERRHQESRARAAIEARERQEREAREQARRTEAMAAAQRARDDALKQAQLEISKARAQAAAATRAEVEAVERKVREEAEDRGRVQNQPGKPNALQKFFNFLGGKKEKNDGENRQQKPPPQPRR